MPGELVPIIIVPAIFFSFVMVVKIIADNAVRRKLIDKGMVDENAKVLFEKHNFDYVPNSLKYGMILIGVGAAILLGQIVPYSIQEEITISAMFILAGLALVIYYFIAAKLKKEDS